MKFSTKFCVYAGLVAAVSYVIAKLTVFPIFPAAPFLKMHFGEVPLLLIMVCGSWQLALSSLFVKEILSFIISGSNVLALLADYVAVAVFLLVTKFVLKKTNGKFLPFLFAAAVGSVVRMIVAVPVNIVVLHLQYGSSLQAVMAQMVYILPFNFLKAMLSGLCVAFVYPKARLPLTKHLKDC